MLFKGFGLGLFVVLAALLILGTFAADYGTFLTQHYDNPKSNVGNNYCNTMMQRQGLTRPRCKEVNSFIHATTNNIIAVCGGGGQNFQVGNEIMRRSTAQFQVTTCTLRGKSNRPPCEYRENMSRRNIVVACRPVHYEEGHIMK